MQKSEVLTREVPNSAFSSPEDGSDCISSPSPAKQSQEYLSLFKNFSTSFSFSIDTSGHRDYCFPVCF